MPPSMLNSWPNSSIAMTRLSVTAGVYLPQRILMVKLALSTSLSTRSEYRGTPSIVAGRHRWRLLPRSIFQAGERRHQEVAKDHHRLHHLRESACQSSILPGSGFKETLTPDPTGMGAICTQPTTRIHNPALGGPLQVLVRL